MSVNYRKLWEERNGSIPSDDYGRTYEIHHKDGNHENNVPENLECLSIEDHYFRHLAQGDLGACVMIARRMMKSPEELHAIQLGGTIKLETRRKIAEAHKRGHLNGTIKSWNQDKGGYRLNVNRSGKRYSSKLSDEIVLEIRARFTSWADTPYRGTREHGFAKLVHAEYGVSLPTLRNILTGKSWAENITWV